MCSPACLTVEMNTLVKKASGTMELLYRKNKTVCVCVGGGGGGGGGGGNKCCKLSVHTRISDTIFVFL